jgi:hypothetical protein
MASTLNIRPSGCRSDSSHVSGTLGLMPSAPPLNKSSVQLVSSTSFNPLTALSVHSSTQPTNSGTCAPSISGGTTNVSILGVFQDQVDDKYIRGIQHGVSKGVVKRPQAAPPAGGPPLNGIKGRLRV